MSDSKLFNQILNQIRLDANKINRDFREKGESKEDINFIDIDRFLDVLYALMESNNYLLEDGEVNAEKFTYVEEYPDIEADASDVITYEIIKRAPSKLSGDGAAPFRGTSQYRPRLVREEIDGSSGGKILYMNNQFDNMIRFRCWSRKVSQSRKLASLLETILNKYYFVLRKYVPIIILEGRGNGRLSTEYADNRYMGTPVDIFVRTNELFTIKEQDIICIETKLSLK